MHSAGRNMESFHKEVISAHMDTKRPSPLANCVKYEETDQLPPAWNPADACVCMGVCLHAAVFVLQYAGLWDEDVKPIIYLSCYRDKELPSGKK